MFDPFGDYTGFFNPHPEEEFCDDPSIEAELDEYIREDEGLEDDDY